MNTERLSAYAVIISATVHFLIIAGADIFLNTSFSAKQRPPEITSVPLKEKKNTLLPAIKVMGEEMRLKKDNSPQSTAHSQQDSSSNFEVSNLNSNIAQIPAKDQEAMLRYQDMIKQKIESCRRYPSWAVRQQIEGTVDLKFTILADGRCQNDEIVRSSGYAILDKEAEETIARSSPFPALPKDISRDFVEIYVSIVFCLDND